MNPTGDGVHLAITSRINARLANFSGARSDFKKSIHSKAASVFSKIRGAFEKFDHPKAQQAAAALQRYEVIEREKAEEEEDLQAQANILQTAHKVMALTSSVVVGAAITEAVLDSETVPLVSLPDPTEIDLPNISIPTLSLSAPSLESVSDTEIGSLLENIPMKPLEKGGKKAADYIENHLTNKVNRAIGSEGMTCLSSLKVIIGRRLRILAAKIKEMWQSCK